MVMVPEQVLQRRLTFEDYQQLPDDQDYEIVEGRLYMAPRPRPEHQVVANRCAVALTVHVEPTGLGLVIPDADLVIPDRDIYISPDIMVFLGERAAALERRGWIRSVPDLVVEVLSPTTEDYDRTTKRRIYAELGVPHFWMVDPRSRSITECVLESSHTYRERSVAAPETFHPELFPDLAIDLSRLFA